MRRNPNIDLSIQMELAVGGLAESERSESGSAHEGMVLISLAFIRFPCVIVSLRSYDLWLLSPPAACFSAFELLAGIKT